MSVLRFDRAVSKIAQLSGEATDLVSFWEAATEVLTATVPYFWTPCWYTLDPASLLITSHYHDGLATFPEEWLAAEYYEDDVNKIADVVRSPEGMSTLHEATGGDPSSSPRWQQNMTMGGDQELILGLRTKPGEVWGALGLYREPERPLFGTDEKAFLRAAAPHLASGARRALLMGEAADPEGPDAPGLVILNERWGLESASEGGERWLAELPDGEVQAGRLPSAVLSVAGMALRIAEAGGEAAEGATARVLSRAGTWVALHGACLGRQGGRQIAVIIEPARPAKIYPLLMAAYGLTERERDVTELVLQGGSTIEIARTLGVAAQTVQQHLKSIFEKTGVRSRRDLVGKVFFAHYEPRFRDNERRVANSRPIRGGPAAPERTILWR